MDLLLFFLPQEKIRLPLITIPEEIEIHTTIIRIYAKFLRRCDFPAQTFSDLKSAK